MAARDEAYRAPLLWLLIPYVAGLLFRPDIGSENQITWACVASALAVGALMASRRRGVASLHLWAICIALAAFLFGNLRMGSQIVQPERWRTLPPREVTLEVEITRVFATNERKPVPSALANVLDAPRVVGDLTKVRVYLSHVALPTGGQVSQGHVLKVTGVIESVFLDPRIIGRSTARPASDSFRDFLIANAVYFKVTRCRVDAELKSPSGWQRARSALGARFGSILSAGLPRENSAVGAYLAMFLGRKDALSAEQKLDYLQTGAMHLFAISGLHIAAIAACMHGLLRLVRMPDLLRASLGIAALVAFVEATGGTPSARRALVMVALVWVGGSLRRPANPLASIAAAALAVLILDPLAIRSISFQFSYAVVGMLLLYAAPLTNRCLARWHPWAHLPDAEWRWWHKGIFFGGRRLIIMTCTSSSAALVSTPLTVAYFGLATPGGILANLVLVPVALYSITSGFASLLCGLVGAIPLSIVFNHAATLILTGMNAFAHAAADWPWMFFEGRFASDWIAPALVAATLLLCMAGYGVRWSRVPGGLLLPPALLITALVFLVRPPRPSEESRLMKSAYELAMERLQRAQPDTDLPLSQGQKEQLAEINRIFQGKIAEREIFLKQRLAEAQSRGELEESEKIRQQIASERTRLEEEREEEKERVRRSGPART